MSIGFAKLIEFLAWSNSILELSYISPFKEEKSDMQEKAQTIESSGLTSKTPENLITIPVIEHFTKFHCFCFQTLLCIARPRRGGVICQTVLSITMAIRHAIHYEPKSPVLFAISFCRGITCSFGSR
jgi:hypothetical protein